MRTLITILLVLNSFIGFCQKKHQEIKRNIEEFQNSLNEEYKNPLKSPLDSVDLINFKEHKFFKINLKYRLEAKFEKANFDTVKMMVSSNKAKKEFLKYGYATFIFEEKSYKLTLYQSVKYMNIPEYANDLFLPFTDLTNGYGSYGGGRYLDLKIPSGDKIIIDFNKAYNPYCAYSHKYSCPIPPKENFIPLQIKSGIKAPK